ncbi:hypothetical protein BD413DRAFT_653610 [Trametes elegans]|nr:hypothetical protein BD413DRAFT_653610 [Trametes elegans]
MKASFIRALSPVLFVTSLLVLVVSHSDAWLKQVQNPVSRSYTYRGADFPHTWPLPALPTVHLTHEDGTHYAIDTPLGVAEWNATLPRGGALVRLGPDLRPFTLSFFHQLRCLNIIRGALMDVYRGVPEETREKHRIVHHCLNYVRQTVMCRADTRLETVRAPTGRPITVSDITHTCKDWTAVYKAAEENYDRYAARMGDGER